MEGKIIYPYLPEGREILYVDATNEFIAKAKEYAKQHSLDAVMPNATVIVRNQKILGVAANGSNYHEKFPCKRIELKCKSGEGYEFCEGCSPKNHSEVKAIKDAHTKGHDTNGADLYLWGHWWFCKDCWSAIMHAGIKNTYLLKGSEELFNKDSPNNIVGKQFE